MGDDCNLSGYHLLGISFAIGLNLQNMFLDYSGKGGF
jgi:hypothetical protein